ncbi:MAG: DUF2189 domain-containing protein [Rhodobacteraceae bacterium]|nr:DUF2189 domain-containing protein [Paracoccaceae bacterium]
MSDQASQQTHIAPSAIPTPRVLELDDLRYALRAGFADFARAPIYGLGFSLFYVLGGLILYAVFIASGQSWWFIPIAVGFPLLAPFAATGLYEVSRRLEQGMPLNWPAVARCIFDQRDRQMPSMAMVILLAFMFWVFVAHTIFALFFGLRPIQSSTLDMLLSGPGLMMLAIGGAIGGVMAAVLFALSVISLPLLLDKELDFITAMITSFSVVTTNLKVMVVWAAIIAAMVFAAMLPIFLGLFIVLPLLGHATWHLYRRALA